MKRILIPLIACLLAGCESTPGPATDTRVTQPPATIETTGDVQDLLAAAGKALPPRSTELMIRAAELAIELGDHAQAGRIIELVSPTEATPFARRYYYAQARIALAAGDADGALAALANPRLLENSLTETDQVNIGEIRAEAYFLSRSFLASARERIFIHRLLEPEMQAANNELIFAALMELPANTLLSQAEKAITSDLRGWLSLAAMTKRYQNDPLRQLTELNNWKKVWSSHPAAVSLPASLALLSRVVAEQPDVIAVLLPLQGDLGPFGRAIRDGFLAAHYAAGAQTRIVVYDTTSETITTLVNRAARDGAELIVGPLDRQRVTQLAGVANLPVPVLALNRTLDGSVGPDLYQFGLAPEDEVLQVAEQAFMEGKRNALVLFAEGEWGRRNFTTFEQRWQELGGNIVDAAAFENERDYSDLVKGLLNVAESEDRATELRRITGQRFEFTPRRRQDIDFIFLLANPSQARGLNPTLAFFYAEDLPVYATSHVHEYSDSRIESIDLNGIRFCDIPWKLNDSDELQQRVETLWPGARSSLAPFFALGADAYRVHPRLQQLKEIPGTRLFGATGVLELNAANIITRSLMWAQFRDGAAIVVPLILDVSVR
ncbi:MAG: penicillin-binding protein activator [Pseudomonadota bacterium]